MGKGLNNATDKEERLPVSKQIYPFCRRNKDGLEHILVHCPLILIWGLWADLLSVVGACWTCPFLVKDLICSWVHFPVRKNVRRLWWAAPS